MTAAPSRLSFVRGHTLRVRAESWVAPSATLIGRVSLTTASVRYSATLREDYRFKFVFGAPF